MRRSTRTIKQEETPTKERNIMLSEYIEQLKQLLNENGDHPMVCHAPYGPMNAYQDYFISENHLPILENRRVKKGKEQWNKIWSKHLDEDVPKGELIYVL